jgi:pectin methylesterase-like acyl-CoA thioesterase
LSATICAATPGVYASDRAKSEWVQAAEDGKLVYKTTSAGDRIVDFSYAGYMGGGVAIPNVPVKRSVKATGGADDRETIQAAIDEVAMMPIENNFRGTVLLGPGTFTCSEPITISVSGIVLRGSGASGEKGTTLKLAGSPHLGIQHPRKCRAKRASLKGRLIN